MPCVPRESRYARRLIFLYNRKLQLDCSRNIRGTTNQVVTSITKNIATAGNFCCCRRLQGLGLGEEDIKSLFGYFDVDTSGEIDITEFRRFFQEDVQLTERQVQVSPKCRDSHL